MKKTILDNSQRIFLVQSQGFGNTKDFFCNLSNIPFILAEYFEPNEDYKIFEYWNRKLKVCSKKHLNDMFKANQINPKNIIQTIDVNALEWFDKTYGNSYFAANVVLNYGLKTEKTIKIPFKYGYGDSYKYEALKELLKLDLVHGVVKYSHGGIEDIYTFCQRNKITLKTSKKENCKKSDLKTI
jgi:hypothetical protein